MQFEGAVVREGRVEFAVVVVKKQVVDDRARADAAIRSFATVFPGLPVVLMAQDTRGTPTYYGRRDISRFLSGVPANAIPWRRYTIN